MARRLIYLPRPLTHQLPILCSAARYKVAVCGRRWGKSTLGLISCVEGHGPRNSGLRGALDGGAIWWVAPTYPIASMIWRDLKYACRDVWTDKSEVERRIVLPPHGGSITVRSASDPDSLRGPGLDGVVLDEAASMSEDAWTQSLRPALADRRGWAVFIGTPKGGNWFRDLYSRAEHAPGWERWRRPTSDNPLVTPAELAGAKSELGSLVYQQEFGAEFIAAGAGMLRREWLRVFPSDADLGPVTGDVRAWDLAATAAGGAYTVGVRIAALCPGAPVRWLIRHAVRGQWTPGTRDAVILQTAQADGRTVRVRPEQEPGSGGVAQVDALVRMLAGYWVDPVRPTGDKVVRAGPFCAQAEAGQVGIIAGDWNSWYLDALESFPATGKDEMDATSHAFDGLVFPGSVGPVDPKTKLAPHQLAGMMPGLRRDDNWDDD